MSIGETLNQRLNEISAPPSLRQAPAAFWELFVNRRHILVVWRNLKDESAYVGLFNPKSRRRQPLRGV